jgi:outer membrane protein insertion porin family
MKPPAGLWLAAAFLAAGPRPSAAQDAPTVLRLEIRGNRFLEKDTLLYYVSTKPGDRYDEGRLREDFRRLWDTGFLDNLRLDVLDAPEGGRVPVFQVVERARVAVVVYRGSKALTTSAIEEELAKRGAALKLDTFYDAGRARRVEQVVRAMLAAKGRPFATVSHAAQPIGPSSLQVSFTIDDGALTRVRAIEFEGNRAMSDATLRGAMKALKPSGFWNPGWLSGKSTYNEAKWSDPHEGDRRRLLDFYLDRGYVTAAVGEPRLSWVDEATGQKPRKGATLVIPVVEGDLYRVGTVAFEGLTVFEPASVRPLFRLDTGDVYRESRIEKGYAKLREAYGSRGYFQWTARTDRRPDPAHRVVDVTLVMDEDRRYSVGKIAFAGNLATRDKVLRREVYLNEGGVFDTEALKLSIRRINQLGYFKPMEGAPQIAPSALGDDKLDVTFKVEEQNRNQFTFGGGMSGPEGAFLNLGFSTTNFLGRGQTLQLAAQSGAQVKHYQIGLTEPYLFDRPITAAFDLFKRENVEKVLGYTREGQGGSFTVGLPLGRFSRLYTSYAYEIVDIRGLPMAEPLGTGGGPVFDPSAFVRDGRQHESRLSPSFVLNTVDNPWTPRSGLKLSLTPQLTGGPLGGTVSLFKPRAELTMYVPHTRKTALGLHAETAFVTPLGGGTLPGNHRFALGGDTQIRGVKINTVGPFEGGRALGGNKYVLFNAEYYFDLGGPLRALAFFDAGQAFLESDPIHLRKLRTSAGLELRFMVPMLNVPFRIIYAVNPNKDDFQKRGTFKFGIGTTF